MGVGFENARVCRVSYARLGWSLQQVFYIKYDPMASDVFSFSHRLFHHLFICVAVCAKWHPFTNRWGASADDMSTDTGLALLRAYRSGRAKLSALLSFPAVRAAHQAPSLPSSSSSAMVMASHSVAPLDAFEEWIVQRLRALWLEQQRMAQRVMVCTQLPRTQARYSEDGGWRWRTSLGSWLKICPSVSIVMAISSTFQN